MWQCLWVTAVMGGQGVLGWLLPPLLSDRVVFLSGKGPLCPTASLLMSSLPCFVLTAMGILGIPSRQ